MHRILRVGVAVAIVGLLLGMVVPVNAFEWLMPWGKTTGLPNSITPTGPTNPTASTGSTNPRALLNKPTYTAVMLRHVGSAGQNLPAKANTGWMQAKGFVVYRNSNGQPAMNSPVAKKKIVIYVYYKAARTNPSAWMDRDAVFATTNAKGQFRANIPTGGLLYNEVWAFQVLARCVQDKGHGDSYMRSNEIYFFTSPMHS